MKIKCKNLFENKAKAIEPFNLRIQGLNEIKINPKIIRYHPSQNSIMDHKSTNSKTRTNQVIPNQNTPHHLKKKKKKIPQRPR